MCGIAGLIGGDERTIKKMTSALRHRGPDDEGFYNDNDVWLGHRRLSIIDISGGHQPMVSGDGKTAIVFNGEIYNFKELKKELSQKYDFRTQSDTEVILNGWLEWGENVFSRLEGMFAAGIWDVRTKTLVLARDRMGEKPLYYFYDQNFFSFASELKGLLENPKIKREIDLESLGLYLSFGHVPSPKSIFKNIFKLEPAKMLIFKEGQIGLKSYWHPDFSQKYSGISLREAEKELENKIASRVGRAMLADVPVGVFLSGGLDSSVVAYFAKKANPDLKTFSIGFKEKSFDESSFARKAADLLGTNHREKIIDAGEMMKIVPKIAEITDEPLADPSIIPTFILSEFARKEVKVVLGGDGGDEALLGYQTFVAEKLWRGFRFFSPIFKIILKIAGVLVSASGKYMSFDFKLQRFFSATEKDPALRHQQWLANIRKNTLSSILSQESGRSSGSTAKVIEDYFFGKNYSSDWDKISEFYLKFYLGDQVLTKVDRASMANSLEVRAPLLNHDFVEYVLNLPIDFRLRGLKTKYILRRIASRYFPKSITKRKKQGFAVPMGAWLKKELKEFGFEKISALKTSGWFNNAELDKLWREHQTGKTDRRMELWNLIVLQLWREKWLK